MLNNVGEIEEPVIERTYKFFGFNGLDQCQYKDKVPQDLPLYIREPFDNWYYTNKMPPYKGLGGSDLDYFTLHLDTILERNLDCKFNPNNSGFKNSFENINIDHTIKMDYNGPKYLLEEDKDFYVNAVKCPLQQNKRWEEGRTAIYYLHFNPVKQYITLYKEKMNIKEK